MKKLIILLIICSNLISANIVFAGTDNANIELGTLIPITTDTDCKSLLDGIEQATQPPDVSFKEFDKTVRNNVLSCAIMTGRIHLWMIPFYVVYLIEFLIGIAGLVAVLFLVIGGFQYVASGLSEQKDKAKGTIKNALLGLGVALAAWTVVNLIQYIVTL